MTNSRAGSGKWVSLDKHIAVGTETTYTLTKSLNLLDTYSEIKIIMDCTPTASFELRNQIDGKTSGYYWAISKNIAGTLTQATAASAAHNVIADTALINGVGNFTLTLRITFGLGQNYNMSWTLAKADDFVVGSATNNAATTGGTIESIKLLVSTSSWAIGTRITVYGLRY